MLPYRINARFLFQMKKKEKEKKKRDIFPDTKGYSHRTSPVELMLRKDITDLELYHRFIPFRPSDACNDALTWVPDPFQSVHVDLFPA